MSDPFALIKVRSPSATDVLRGVRLGKPALALLEKDMTPRQYLEALLRGGRLGDAAKFLAFALPKREAVWWGCLAVRLVVGELAPEEGEAVTAAGLWVVEPNDRHREEAEAHTAKGKPGGALAQSVAWSGGSMTKPPLPPVAPPGSLTHMCVYQALTLAAIQGKPDKLEDNLRKALVVGLRVARGLHPWPAVHHPDPHGQYRHP